MKMTIKTLTLVLAASMLPFTGCKKSTDSTTDLTMDDQTAVMDQAQLEKVNNDAEFVADNAAISGSAEMRTTPSALGGCATVTKDTSSSPHVLTIDFGSGCTDSKGNTRKGKIIVTYNKGYKDSGSFHTITYSNYYYNDNQLTGSKTVENMGRNSDGHYYYDITVNDSLILKSGDIFSWTGSRTRVWREGYGSASIWDDQYDVYGTQTVVRPSGKSTTFTVNASTPLHIAADCKWIESGKMTAVRSTGVTFTIDFGSGSCDATATVTTGKGKTFTITLR